MIKSASSLAPSNWLLKITTVPTLIRQGISFDVVSPWHSGETHPDIEGWYERFFIDGVYKHFWDGFRWSSLEGGEPHWWGVGSYPAWREFHKAENLDILARLMTLVDEYKYSIGTVDRLTTRTNLEYLLNRLLIAKCKYLQLIYLPDIIQQSF